MYTVKGIVVNPSIIKYGIFRNNNLESPVMVVYTMECAMTIANALTKDEIEFNKTRKDMC